MNKIDGPICVVDYDATILEAVGSLLRAEGLRVETFHSAKEFLTRANVHPPACLILDVILPGLNGIDLQRELFRAEYRIPIIFLTAYDDIPYRNSDREHTTAPYPGAPVNPKTEYSLKRHPTNVDLWATGERLPYEMQKTSRPVANWIRHASSR